MSMPVLCIAGGGTGGHVMPACTLADCARHRWPDLQVDFIGAERGLEATLLPERGESVLLLTMHSVQNAHSMQKLRVLLWELPRAVLHIWKHWRQHTPKLVVGVGGYASVAGVVAALLRRIPVILYEQNAMPGLVNRRLAPFCQRVALGFAEAAQHVSTAKTIHTGNLIASGIKTVQWRPHTPPRLLVLGGSQGSIFFNETIPKACASMVKAGHVFRVTHVAGGQAGRVEKIQTFYQQAGIESEVIGFCSDMPGLYARGDMMIARAGAMTVSEAAQVGMPTLFIPLPQAADHHQHRNAETLLVSSAAVMLDQMTADYNTLASTLTHLLFNPARLQTMSQAATAAAVSDAESRMLDMLAPWLDPQA